MAELIALSIRLYMTCCIFPMSAKTIWMVSEKVSSKRIFFAPQVPSKEAAVSLITRLMSKLVRERYPLASKEFRVSILSVRL